MNTVADALARRAVVVHESIQGAVAARHVQAATQGEIGSIEVIERDLRGARGKTVRELPLLEGRGGAGCHGVGGSRRIISAAVAVAEEPFLGRATRGGRGRTDATRVGPVTGRNRAYGGEQQRPGPFRQRSLG